MTISETAQRNHEALFPGHVSTLKVTDPELIEVFDNFAFDEVLAHGDLDARTRLMVQLAAIIASPSSPTIHLVNSARAQSHCTRVSRRDCGGLHPAASREPASATICDRQAA